MKNIFLLPTEKPSRLHFDSELFISPNYQLSNTINSIVQGRNIYITSDEEIKEGDWVITPTNDIIQWAKVFQPIGKKIILTTAAYLIKDGVQPIDDEFLQWFVKNQSCEKVDIKTRELAWGQRKYNDYKIIIPKEEPKQELIVPSGYYDEDSKDFEIASLVDFTDDEQESIEIMQEAKEMAKEQETLEEASSKEGLYRTSQNNFDQASAGYNAKWFKRGALFGAKWQQERMYSEEDMKEAFIAGGNSQIEEDDDYGTEYDAYMEEWFAQFKKKEL